MHIKIVKKIKNKYKKLRGLFLANKFTDVVLVCQDETSNREANSSKCTTIPCHKVVLSAFSPYFKAMFSSNLIETKTNKVNMSQTDYSTLNDVVNYAYCGSIHLNVNNVQSLFSLASLLQVSDLLDACSDFMVANLDVYNSIDVYSLSKRYSNEYLR